MYIPQFPFALALDEFQLYNHSGSWLFGAWSTGLSTQDANGQPSD